MAKQIRNTEPVLSDVVDAFNSMKAFVVTQLRLAEADVAAISADPDIAYSPTFVSLGSHNDKSEVTVTAANATDLATSLVLVNDILAVYKFHMADTAAHKVAGVALASYDQATDLTAAMARANDIKSKYNTHRASTTHHYVADSTNAVSSADATDQGSLNTLLNEIKTDLNAHMASGPSIDSLRLVGA